MTSRTDTDAALDPLWRLLGRLRREARAWIWVESLALVAVAAAALVAATLALDWLVEPPAWVRATMLTASAAMLAWILVTRLFTRLAATLSDHALALAVERRQPELGDTLSTAVELAAAERPDIDPALRTRTTRAAGALAATASPARIFRRRRLVAVAALGVAAAGGLAGWTLARPDLAGTWTRRVLLLGDEPWPRRVRLEAEGFVDGVRTVARGSDVDLLVQATAESGPLPELVELRLRGREGWRTVRMGTRGGADAAGQRFGHLVEAVADDLELEVRGGDGRLRGLRLAVVDPPTLAGATLFYTLPDYLGGGERRPPFSRVVPVPRGARVDVTFTATKPLAAARLTARFAAEAAGDGPAEVVLAERTAADPPSDALAGTIPVLEADGTLSLAATDTDGIAAREPFSLVLTAVPDEPPSVAVQLADITLAVTPAARLPIVGTLADDHGLATAAVEIARGDDAWSLPIARVRGGETLLELPPEKAETVLLAPLALAVGDRLAVTVMARDGCGLSSGPNQGRGDTWLLDVVAAESLLAALEAREILLRQRFEAAIEDLEQARRGLGARQPAPQEPSPQPADADRLAAGRLEEAAARAAGEVGEIAAAFRGIRNEHELNGLLTPELETRLITHVSEPLAGLAAGGLDGLVPACRETIAGGLPLQPLASRADASLAALRAVLARMLELESFNELVEKLRGVIRTQEQIRADTLERQRRRARQALEAP